MGGICRARPPLPPFIFSLTDTARALVGSRHAHRSRHRALRARELTQPLASLAAGGAAVPCAESPIFILSAGWRSGSTLLQRLLMSGGDTLLWGEPFDRACLVQRLADSLRPFSADWPAAGEVVTEASLQSMPHRWIANLYPPLANLQSGYRALLEELFKRPAMERGALRWGFKEVRLGVEEARLLRWLYPQARIIFLYRNPYDAYCSYKAFQQARGWYVRWPEQHAFTPWAFGRHWRRLVGGFVAEAAQLGALLICYESLVSGARKVDDIAAYCDLALDSSVLAARIGSSRAEPAQGSLTALERRLIWLATAPLADRLGYGAEENRQARAMPTAQAIAAAGAEKGFPR